MSEIKVLGVEWYDVKTKFKKIIRSFFYANFVQELICQIIILYIKIVSLTSKKVFNNREIIHQRFKNKQPTILTAWHSRIMMSPLISLNIKEANKTNCMAAIASKHGDGRFVGKVLEKFGVIVIAGSSKVGRKASRGIDMHGLKEIFRVIKNELGLAITPDGPRGPAKKVGGEVIKIAKLSGAPIMPFSFGYSRFFELNTWDKFRVPLPFGTIVCNYGDLIWVDKNIDEEGIKKQNLELEEKINFTTAQADKIAGCESDDNFPQFSNYYVRKFEESDLELIKKLRQNSQVQQHHPDGIFSDEKCQKYFVELTNHYQKHQFSYLPIFEKNTNRFVGIAGLMFFDDQKENFQEGEVELGYALMPEFWGNGIATLISDGFVKWGFANLAINKIIAVCNPVNSGSIKVVEKLGGKYVRTAINPRVGDEVLMYEIVNKNNQIKKL